MITFQGKWYNYEENIISQNKLINSRVYFELLTVQLSLLQNFELDDCAINNYIGEKRIDL